MYSESLWAYAPLLDEHPRQIALKKTTVISTVFRERDPIRTVQPFSSSLVPANPVITQALNAVLLLSAAHAIGIRLLAKAT